MICVLSPGLNPLFVRLIPQQNNPCFKKLYARGVLLNVATLEFSKAIRISVKKEKKNMFLKQ